MGQAAFGLVQSQRQTFSAHMQHGLALLQMSAADLAAEIMTQAESNPLIDLCLPRTGVSGAGLSGTGMDDDRIGRLASPGPSLGGHLRAQLALTQADAATRRLAGLLIDEVEADGYLRVPLEDVADQSGAPMAAVTAALALVQGFEPAGVMARSLRECLALQLEARGALTLEMDELLDRLDLVARGDRQRLRAELGCTREELDGDLALLRSLTPKPGLSYGSEPVAVLMPEVRVRRGPGGDWEVESHAPHLPRIIVREARYQRLRPQVRAGADAGYLDDRIAAARRFEAMLQRRGRTLLEIAAEIVRLQPDWFDHGPAAIRPLMMKTVAANLAMHESTVSRAVDGKAMATPHGVVAFRTFFASASTFDGDTPHEAVLDRIRTLIAREGAKILSDEAIALRMSDEGIPIARRTVAKHREAMGIATSALRKRAVRG